MIIASHITDKAKQALDSLHIRYTDRAYGDAWRVHTIHTQAPFTIKGIKFVMVDDLLQLASEHDISPEYLILRTDLGGKIKYSIVPADQVVGTFYEKEAAQALLDLLRSNTNAVASTADVDWMREKLNGE